MSWNHNKLAFDLAEHLRGTSDRLVWTDMQIGPSGSARPDVYTIPKSYSKFRPMAYEVKISVADFRRDVTAGKWQSYLEFSAAVIFAVPRGLVSKADVPDGCGLIVRSDDGWRNVKGPTLRHLPTLPHEAWMKIMIDGLSRQRSELNIKQGPQWSAQKAAEAKFGAAIASLFRDCNSMEFGLTQKRHDLQSEINAVSAQITDLQRSRWCREKKQLEGEREQIDKLWADLCASLGLKPDRRWEAREKIAALHGAMAIENEVSRATNALLSAHKAIKDAIDESSASSEKRVREWMEIMGEAAE